MRAAGALLLLVCTGFLLTPAAQAQEYGFVKAWETGAFNTFDVATDPFGSVYVAADTDPIQKYTSAGGLVAKWGIPAESRAVATDAAGNVYVVADDRVQKLGPTGILLAVSGQFGDRDTYGIATDAAGNVFVSQGGSAQPRVLKFGVDLSLVGEWEIGALGDANSVDVEADAAGNVYVVRSGRPKVLKFATTGAFLGEWGSKGKGNGQFDIPNAVAVDVAGNVYVAEGGSSATLHRVQKFTPDGGFLAKWGSFGSVCGDVPPPPGTPRTCRKGQIYYPTGIDVDSVGNVYVSDGADRVLKYAPLPPRPALKKGPKGKTKKRKAVFFFRFRSPTPGARFQCRLTGQRVPKKQKRWRRCRSPKRYKGLRPGRKVFWVRATLRGQVGKPDKRRWRVIR